ncbi:MAG: hypothetical protein R2685_04880 [Candidatus Nitrosocosmicus sp.]|nr:hypothetical protein [Candidatus Nitrosocosmicus sp.]
MIKIWLIVLLSAFGAPLSYTGVSAQQQDKVTGSNAVEFLSIQTAKSGSITEDNATNYQLELSGIDNKTIMFSDRPQRIVEPISTSDFIANWTVVPNSFKVDPPNAVLVYEDKQTGNLDTAIVELFNPVYNKNTNTLTYGITKYNSTSIEMPSDFGQSTLIIDPECISQSILGCY